MIEGGATCETAMAETTPQSRRSSQQFRRSANSPPRVPTFESHSAQQRRSTLCPAELDRMNSPGQFSESNFEEEKMLFEQSIRGRVSMTPGGKPRACRGLARGRMHRFVSKVSDDLRFRDVLWRSAVFSMYTAEERRRFAFPEKERRFQEDRGGLGWFSIDGRLLNAESATSRDRIGGHLSCEEALAWEGFSPLQRVLIVAIAAAAAANSKRGVEIKPAERPFDNRDQALNFVWCKLNNLWERISSLHDQSGSRNAGGCVSRGPGDNDGLQNWKGKTGDVEKIPLESTHAPCAAAILELKRRTEHMIEKEVSNVMVAFASVLEKVEALEIYGRTPEARQNKDQGVALGDLKMSVDKASAQITSLQMSLSDIWHALLPEALCAINISPSELEHYLDKAKKESSMLFPSRRFDIQAWRQWLNMQEHASEATFIPVLQDETEDDALFKMLLTATEQEERRFSDISDWSASVTSFSDHNIWHSAEADVAIGAAAKRSMDKIAAPLDVKNSGSNGYSQELAVEKSLGELEITSTKVANLESQLASLKEYLKVCEKKRKDAEEKLAEAIQQGIKNQLNFAAKEEEIVCLWKECKQKDATLKEITLAAQKSKNTSDKRLAVMEDICKEKNASITRLKEDMIAMKEKVSEVMRRQTPPSSQCNSECSLPLVVSNNFLFDMDIPLSPYSPRKVLGLKTIEDQYLAANEYVSSSSQGYNKTRHRSSGQSSASSPTSGLFRWNSTGTESHGYHSSKLNSCQSVKSNDLLFDMHIPSSPDSPRKVLGLKTTEDQDFAANEYACSSSQGNNETRQISSGQSSASSITSGRFRKNSTVTEKNEYHSSKVNSGQSSRSKNQLGKSSADLRYMNENTKSGPSSPRKVKSSRSGSVLSGVDTNANLKSKKSSSDSEGLQQNARISQNNKPKDITRKKRWM